MLNEYDLDVTPPESIDDHESTHTEQVSQPSTPQAQPKVEPGSFRQLFSLLSTRHRFSLLLPAVVFSIISGGIAPFMTIVIGQNFNAFAQFPQEPNPPQSAKSQLLHAVGIAALELVGLSVGSIALSAVTSSLWIWTGETNVREVRRRVFGSVISQEMVWFDSRTQGDAVGAAGLMAQFTSDTDSIRLASSIASGLLLQHLVTAITALVLAFVGSPLLTLLTLASVPLLSLIQGTSQRLASRRLSHERQDIGALATLIERSFTLISTVKAFTAVPYTLDKLHTLLYGRMRKNEYVLNAIWGLSSGTSQFVMMGMFVQAFWFGSKLVREGKMEPGAVMSVFWACLIATSNLQLCIPQMVVVGKGKVGMAALMNLVKENSEYDPDAIVPSSLTAPMSPYSLGPFSPSSTNTSFSKSRTALPRSKSKVLRKIQPSPRSFKGDISLSGVTFSYPTRDPSSSQTKPKHVLKAVDMYIAGCETTFVVGSSGSGKSSIAGIIAGFYQLSPGVGGSVLLDDQDTRFLDPAYLSTHIGVVNQGAPVIMSGRSIHYNVAIALASHPSRTIESVTRAEVVDACRAVLLHEFIRDLPDGYDTLLIDDAGVGAGEGSEKDAVQLSGGQKQRLALARAKLRNPGVLILDEPTSALDPTSRTLILAAIRHWRKNKTTLIITHDLSRESILDTDFVYVMKDGKIEEAGYRYDLEDKTAGADEGEFRRLVRMQGLGATDAIAVEDDDDDEKCSPLEFNHASEDEKEQDVPSSLEVMQPLSLRFTRGASMVGAWMFDVVAELTAHNSTVPLVTNTANSPRVSRALSPSRLRDSIFPPRSLSPIPVLPKQFKPSSLRIDVQNANAGRGRARRPSSVSIPSPGFGYALEKVRSPFEDGKGVAREPRRRMSLQFEPATPTSGSFTRRQPEYITSSDEEKRAMERSARTVNDRRKIGTRRAFNVSSAKQQESIEVVVSPSQQSTAAASKAEIPFRTVVRELLPFIPSRSLLVLGLFICILSGAMTPIFSFLLSKLLFEVSTGAKDARTINIFGGIVLGIAALDGVLMGLKFALMESLGWGWVARMREAGMKMLLGQSKSFFEIGANSATENDASAPSRTSPVALTQILTKSGDDAKNLLAVVAGQTLVVFTMLSVGLIWAFAVGWQFTLVGIAIAPIFAGVMSLQSRFVAEAERRSRKGREGVAGVYYETISHIRSIRAAALTPLFQTRFDLAADHAFNMGVKGAFIEGCTYGVASGLIYAAEALLFYVGAVLVAKGTYTYLQMVQVLDLVVFTVTIGSQLMAFTNRIARSVQATRELHAVLQLPTLNSESKGILRPPLNAGPLGIEFQNVTFAYPSRPDAPVLKDISFTIAPGETVALVGSSGCGKSTVAQLLQRLYEPSSGSVHVDRMDVSCIEVDHLRQHVSVVSQQANLFDVSISENISYGNPYLSEVDIVKAAKAANMHDTIMGLPKGYDTVVGENASMLSGGQAQRLQIARALARPCRVLILDECTSALDPENQKVVLDTIKELNVSKQGAQRTTVMVTHKVPAMKLCDRVLVISDGRVVEEGKYDELMERRGVFAQLASGGEWFGE